MRRFLPLLLWTASCDSGLEPDTFKRDQPRIDRLFAWDGGTVAEADRFYRIDVDLEKAVPIDIPGLETATHLVMRGKTPLALGTQGARRLLKERVGTNWVDIPLPEPFAIAEGAALVAADASSIVLWKGGTCAWRKQGEAWRLVKLPPAPWPTNGPYTEPDHAVLQGSLLVLGVDGGEWGGALAAADLEKGSFVLVAAELPVHQLLVDGKDRIWAVQGLNHESDGRGILRVFENGSWRVFAQVGIRGRSAMNWTLEPMSFEAMDVDPQGNPWLLGDGIGVVRWSGNGWSMATRDWPRHTFNGALYPVSASGFRLLGEDSGLVAMGDAGIALWDWRRGRLRRLSLKP